MPNDNSCPNVMPPGMTTPVKQPTDTSALLCLSQELAVIADRCSKEVVRVDQVIGFLPDRAYMFLLLMLSLPFIQELPRKYLNSALGVLQRLLWMLEKVMRPRMTFLTGHMTI
jgi:hypothetical protein